MSTAAQIFANRENSQASTGPVTDAGKSISSQNATKLGLSASGFSLLATEDPNAYQSLLARITAEMQPVTEHESHLVRLMTQARWKLERIQQVEADVLEKMIAGEPVDSQLALIMRYSGAAERSYYKAHKELTQSRRDHANEDQAARQNRGRNRHAAAQAPRIGFVW